MEAAVTSEAERVPAWDDEHASVDALGLAAAIAGAGASRRRPEAGSECAVERGRPGRGDPAPLVLWRQAEAGPARFLDGLIRRHRAAGEWRASRPVVPRLVRTARPDGEQCAENLGGALRPEAGEWHRPETIA